MYLVPIDEVRRRLRIVSQSQAGTREIPIERIVGSVDRSADFGRDFRPRRGLSRNADFDAAARYALNEGLSRADRRAVRGEKAQPLDRRG